MPEWGRNLKGGEKRKQLDLMGATSQWYATQMKIEINSASSEVTCTSMPNCLQIVQLNSDLFQSSLKARVIEEISVPPGGDVQKRPWLDPVKLNVLNCRVVKSSYPLLDRFRIRNPSLQL